MRQHLSGRLWCHVQFILERPWDYGRFLIRFSKSARSLLRQVAGLKSGTSTWAVQLIIMVQPWIVNSRGLLRIRSLIVDVSFTTLLFTHLILFFIYVPGRFAYTGHYSSKVIAQNVRVRMVPTILYACAQYFPNTTHIINICECAYINDKIGVLTALGIK